MKFNTLVLSVTVAGLIAVGACAPKATSPVAQASASPETSPQLLAQAPAADSTGLTIEQKLDLLAQHKGKFGSGDAMRRFFFGDLEPLGVQPGGAGMVVNLYNKANDVTFAYCSTFDVVVAQKPGRVTAFDPAEVK
ncbi:MAG: hypothetical protein KME07_22990 [Pegethrix bostrychoides GSE-TBD4-15B]|jgi:hypothetical protein|uniref:Uncharacterized protein n=1 Tax=Pegethrix bostrychoides GSE-TBD4-15B TaxID=2839662 RepID=A0A951PEV0_9CYAN|nr:hypothetical protein [Pegethrix bostrychoides GSE-TBD4-15B]